MASSCQLPWQCLPVKSKKPDDLGHSRASVLFTTSIDPTVQESQTASRSRARHGRDIRTTFPRLDSAADFSRSRKASKKRTLYHPHIDAKSAENDTAQQPTTSPDKPHDPAYPNPERMLTQPETRPIPREQLVAEVKGIYAGLVMVESKCIEVDNAQSSSNETASKLNNEQWQALIALHRTLLHEHHDFFLASQHPSASPALRRLAAKYAMPASLRRHGVHSFLELLGQRLPASLENMLTFLYLAYSTMELFYETVPDFQDTWIKCLGDLGRYRMAIEDEEVRDREFWTSVSRQGYSKAADKAPTISRLYHHLEILVRPDSLRYLDIYKSLRVYWLTTDAHGPYWQVKSACRPSLHSSRGYRTRGSIPDFPLDQTDHASRGWSLATGGSSSANCLDLIIERAKSHALLQMFYYFVFMQLVLVPFATANSALSRSPLLLGIQATISFTAEVTSLQLKSTDFDHDTPPAKVLLRLLSSLSLVSFIGLALLHHLRSAQEIQRFVGVGFATAGFLRLASRESLTTADKSGDATAWIDEVNLFALIAAVSGVLFVRSKLFTRAFARRRARCRVAEDNDDASDNDGWFREDEETGRSARVDAQHRRDEERAPEDRNGNGDIGLAFLGNLAQSMASS